MLSHTLPLQLVQLSDLHLFAQAESDLLGLRTLDSFEAILSDLGQQHPRPDLLLLTGDLSQDETPAAYARIGNLLRPLNTPTYWLPGNHDHLPTMQQALSTPPLYPDKSIHCGAWRLLLLNSSVPGQVHGHLSATSLAWLEQELQVAAPHPTLIALHHPPFLVNSTWLDKSGLQNSEALFAILDRYNHIKLVLFGHIHQEFHRQRQGVHYLSTPSTCIQFAPQSSGFALDEINPGYRCLTLNPDGSFATQVRRIQMQQQLNLAAQGY